VEAVVGFLRVHDREAAARTKTSRSIVKSNTSNMCPCKEGYILKWTLLATENRAALMKGAGLEAGASSLMVA
jgi:hypothetical protein